MQKESLPWRLIADRQYQESLQREREERLYKEYLKKKYLEELTTQMRLKQAASKYQRQIEKGIDRIQIEKAVGANKRNIEVEQLKNSINLQRNSQVNLENETLQTNKRRQQRQLSEFEKSIEQRKLEETEDMIRQQQKRENQKKQYIRDCLKQQMEEQRNNKRMLSDFDRAVARQKLKQHEEIEKNRAEKKAQELERLKERARKVDYGSHQYFQKNQNKTLLQKKIEEWSIYRDSVEREEKLRKMEEEEKMGRKQMQNYYKKELQDQISQRQMLRKERQQLQLFQDRSSMIESERFSRAMDQNKRAAEESRKSQMREYLKRQQQAKQRGRYSDRGMAQRELRMNKEFLSKTVDYNDAQSSKLNPEERQKGHQQRSSSTIEQHSPSQAAVYKPRVGDSFQFDEHRLKQLKAVQNSMKTSPIYRVSNSVDLDVASDPKKHNYFASKGLSLLR